MAGNSALGAAKTAQNDEFYTQYSDIEAEMARLMLRVLEISS